MRDIVPDVVEKAMASGSTTRAERAVDQENKREREAREIVVQQEDLLLPGGNYQLTASTSG